MRHKVTIKLSSSCGQMLISLSEMSPSSPELSSLAVAYSSNSSAACFVVFADDGCVCFIILSINRSLTFGGGRIMSWLSPDLVVCFARLLLIG